MTLLKDLIHIPEAVRSGDFVLKLTEGVRHPKETLRDYVVTPQLAKAFDDALGFIRSAVESGATGQSKATYLHGSFGSGKSHFMAVLHLLLSGNADARSVPELAPVVAKHDAWMKGRKFLLVPYHVIGAKNLESRILGHYVEHVRHVHPQAPIPPVYRGELLLRDAQKLRERMGEEAFFKALNQGAADGGDDGWGELAADWDGARFEAACRAAPGAEERGRLVGQLIESLFESYGDVAESGGEGFIDLDDGLSAISKHAQLLGYDALVLFLDELILWLATRASDHAFVQEEGSKVSKLVEAENPDRPVPIVSFVARQRDLRELVGRHGTGAEELSFIDVLDYWEARFHSITLEDRNLAEIASRRVLKPKSEVARQQVDAAFHETEKAREEIRQVLLGREGDAELFRKVYPFSPALVQALVAASGALQRERTALKVMMLLLVGQRDELELGQLVPVGDLFDVLAEGEEPFTEKMKRDFENARRLYRTKLVPLLEDEHGIDREAVRELPASDAKARAFRANDRLLKTLLLGALVPEVEALKALTPLKLAALNHGTIRTPVPGHEAQEVLRRCRNWAARVGEIKVGEDSANPVVSIQLSGVETQGILDNALGEDNVGNRRRKVKELLYDRLGIDQQDGLFTSHEVEWRGVRRSFEVIFGNVRSLTDDSLATERGQRKVVIDFPFDPEAASPREDLTRLDEFRKGGRSSRTLAWLPCFLSRRSLDDLGMLVRLDHVLTDEGFRRCAGHLSAVDQAAARPLLSNQRSQLATRLAMALEAAYAVRDGAADVIEESLERSEQFQSLDPAISVRPPTGATLGQAFENLLDQFLSAEQPAHPRLGALATSSRLRKVLAEVLRAVHDPDGRIHVDRPLRPDVEAIAEPLKLGRLHENHFVLGRHWLEHFDRQAARAEEPVTVANLRKWMDVPDVMGLDRELQDLVILVFAEQTNRSFHLHGAAVDAELGRLHDAMELRTIDLPDAEAWGEVVERAGKVLGIAVSPLPSAAGLESLTRGVRQACESRHEACADVVARLERVLADLGIDEATCDRLRSARAVHGWVTRLRAAADERVVELLLAGDVPTSLEAMGRHFKSAEGMRHQLEDASWKLFDGVSQLTDDRRAAAESLEAELRDVLRRDELVVALGPKLVELSDRAVALLTTARPDDAPATEVEAAASGAGDLDEVPVGGGSGSVSSERRSGLRQAEALDVLAELRKEVEGRPAARLDLAWTLRDVDGDR